MPVKEEKSYIENIPTIIWGQQSEKVYLYIHGQGGNKEEAKTAGEILCPLGWQILSIDLPGHGERKEENSFDPWHAVPEIQAAMKFARERWKEVSLFAVSIGAWFSMESLKEEKLEKCLFVSPVIDMKELIGKMMEWAGITEEQLKREGEIQTASGWRLSWKYWRYAVEHPVRKWGNKTEILYGEKDNMISRESIERFIGRFGGRLTVMETGGHWFHTEEEIEFLRKWIEKSAKF